MRSVIASQEALQRQGHLAAKHNPARNLPLTHPDLKDPARALDGRHVQPTQRQTRTQRCTTTPPRSNRSLTSERPKTSLSP